MLHLENPVWSKEMGVEIVAPPTWRTSGCAIRAVSSRYPGRPRRSGGDTGGQSAAGTALTKAVLPSTEAVQALPDLDSMGINNYHLFPEFFTGLADRATMRLVLALAARDS